MIIDVTREFNDEEYKKYLDLLQRYHEKNWLIYEEENEWRESNEWGGTDRFEIPEVIEDMTTIDEDYFLEQIANRVKKCIQHFQQRGWVVIEELLDTNMILWLNKRETSYCVIYNPITLDYFSLTMRDEEVYKLLNAKWRGYIDEKYFVGTGWIKSFIEDYQKDRLSWCEENLGDDFICGNFRYLSSKGADCYFREEAFMAYKLRWL